MKNEEKHIATSTPGPRKKITLITFIALVILTSVIAIFMIFPYLLALAVGVMLALLSYPLFIKLKRRLPAQLASLLLTAGMIFLGVVPLSIFVFLATKQGIAIAQELMQNEAFSPQSIFYKISEMELFKSLFGTLKGAKLQIFEWIKQIGTFALGSMLSVAAQVPNIILQLVLAMISYFYFLVDGHRFINWIYDRVPLDISVRKKIVTTFADTTVSTIWATLAAAAVQTVIMFIAFLTLSVPALFLASAATFIFAWIPIVGSTPVWIVGALYLYTQGFLWKAILMILFGVITGTSDNIVRPFVLKGRANMHPLVSLVAIFGGIGIFGILGVFIGPIIAAVLISLLQVWPVIGQQFGYMSPPAEKAQAAK